MYSISNLFAGCAMVLSKFFCLINLYMRSFREFAMRKFRATLARYQCSQTTTTYKLQIWSDLYVTIRLLVRPRSRYVTCRLRTGVNVISIQVDL